MAARHIRLDNVELLVEVDSDNDIPDDRVHRNRDRQNRDERELVGARDDGIVNRTGELRQVLEGVVGPMKEVLDRSAPAEWSIEVGIGFKGESGIPCLMKGQASGSIKLVAKWKK